MQLEDTYSAAGRARTGHYIVVSAAATDKWDVYCKTVSGQSGSGLGKQDGEGQTDGRRGLEVGECRGARTGGAMLWHVFRVKSKKSQAASEGVETPMFESASGPLDGNS